MSRFAEDWAHDWALWFGLAVASLVLLSCEGVVVDPAAAMYGSGDQPPVAKVTPPVPGEWLEPTCTTAQCVGSSSLPRLTALEYENSIADVFGLTPDVSQLPPDGATAGAFFTNDQKAVQLEDPDSYRASAEAIADAVVTSSYPAHHPLYPGQKVLAVLLTRAGSCTRHDAACAEAFVRRFGGQLYRRALSDDEVAEYKTLFAWAVTVATDGALVTGGSATFEEAVRYLVEQLLQSPHFLYRPERGLPTADPAVVQLTSREVAARLAAFLTRSVPDDELSTAADRDELLDPAQVERQAQRLLASAHGDRVWRYFAQDWLSTRQLPHATARSLPEGQAILTDAVVADLATEVQQTFSHLAQTDGRLTTLLTSPGTVLQGGSLDWAVGVKGASGTWAPEVPNRHGILTLPGVLIANGHAGFTRAHQRGLFVRGRLLCQSIPPPPANVAASVAAILMKEAGSPSAVTSRGQLQAVTQSNAVCNSCHRLTNPVGFAFDGYDDLGRARSVEKGTDGLDYAIDTSGTLEGVPGTALSTDVDGPFKDGDELLTRLAGSHTVERCMARQFARFALQREPVVDDQPSIEAGAEQLRLTGGDLRALVVGLTSTESFRHRRTAPTH